MDEPMSGGVERKSPWRQAALGGLQRVVPKHRLFVRGSEKSRSVYLTFDDGPDPVRTTQVLDVLQKYSVQATFFVVGQQAAAHRNLLRRVAEMGHAIGGHTYYHHRPEQVNARQLMSEIHETDAVLRETLGITSPWFRPPFGKLTVGKLWRLWADRRTIVLWNRDPRDYRASTAREVIDWVQQNPISGGDVLLFHDTAPHTAAALDEIVPYLRKAGLDFAALGEN